MSVHILSAIYKYTCTRLILIIMVFFLLDSIKYLTENIEKIIIYAGGLFQLQNNFHIDETEINKKKTGISVVYSS